MAKSGVLNALSVDVEDYYQVAAFDPVISRAEWPDWPRRVRRNTDVVLDLCARTGVKGTFFVLGCVAEEKPRIVRRIVAEGHELASHGYGHARACDLSREELREDLTRAKAVLEAISGVEVTGYRAPNFSIDQSNWWAFDVLKETGHSWSSSVNPIAHDHYGLPGAPRFPFQPIKGFTELPITTLEAMGRRWPAGGGGFFRLLPYAYSRLGVARVNGRDNRPAIFYFHPWEIDPDQPRVPGAPLKSRARHYVNLERMEAKLARLLADFRWGRIDEAFVNDLNRAPEPWSPVGARDAA